MARCCLEQTVNSSGCVALSQADTVKGSRDKVCNPRKVGDLMLLEAMLKFGQVSVQRGFE